jgi:CO dehydrogenase/acetyl-CoA synthase beta subunit
MKWWFEFDEKQKVKMKMKELKRNYQNITSSQITMNDIISMKVIHSFWKEESECVSRNIYKERAREREREREREKKMNEPLAIPAMSLHLYASEISILLLNKMRSRLPKQNFKNILSLQIFVL